CTSQSLCPSRGGNSRPAIANLGTHYPGPAHALVLRGFGGQSTRPHVRVCSLAPLGAGLLASGIPGRGMLQYAPVDERRSPMPSTPSEPGCSGVGLVT